MGRKMQRSEVFCSTADVECNARECLPAEHTSKSESGRSSHTKYGGTEACSTESDVRLTHHIGPDAGAVHELHADAEARLQQRAVVAVEDDLEVALRHTNGGFWEPKRLLLLTAE